MLATSKSPDFYYPCYSVWNSQKLCSKIKCIKISFTGVVCVGFQWVSYRTKCWKMYLSIWKLTGANLFSSPRNANKRLLRSVFTSIFNWLDGAARDTMDAVGETNEFIDFVLKRYINSQILPAISSNSVMRSLSNSGGKCFEKKSFNAVATAFTGMSSTSISAFGSVWVNEKCFARNCIYLTGKRLQNSPSCNF